jgi:hypothetical protein
LLLVNVNQITWRQKIRTCMSESSQWAHFRKTPRNGLRFKIPQFVWLLSRLVAKLGESTMARLDRPPTVRETAQ